MRSPLDAIEIASPCEEPWDGMKGDDHQRHCERCGEDVFDLSSLTRAEAEALLRARGSERVCVRLFRRADGRVLTRDCPVGRATGERRSFLAAGLAGAASLLLGAGSGLLASAKGRRALPILGDVEPVMGRMRLPEDRAEMGQLALPAAELAHPEAE